MKKQFNIKHCFKNHIGIIIILVFLLLFPTSFANQNKLNMKIIVTGIAIDKSEDGYEATAQIVKTSPGTESPGVSATINFISDKDESLLGAMSKISYKAGKVSAFTHTNFIIIGKELMENDDMNNCLNYFIRDRITKNTAMILFADGKAKDEIKKTKDVELSVGIGLQKVYMFKEKESDGIMMTVLDFLNNNEMLSKTAVASVISLKSEDESDSESENSGSQQNEDKGESSNITGDASGKNSSESSSESSGEQQGGDKYKYFGQTEKLVCFYNGKYKGELSENDEVLGYMLGSEKTKREDFTLKNLNCDSLKDVVVGVRVKNKGVKKCVRYENGSPKLDIEITVKSSKVEEIQSQETHSSLTKEEYDAIQKALIKNIKRKISACFEKSEELGIDIFRAYDLAFKTQYNETIKNYSSAEDFIRDLKINVNVKIKQMEY